LYVKKSASGVPALVPKILGRVEVIRINATTSYLTGTKYQTNAAKAQPTSRPNPTATIQRRLSACSNSIGPGFELIISGVANGPFDQISAGNCAGRGGTATMVPDPREPPDDALVSVAKSSGMVR
jgi:hypothetical protein